MKSLTEVIKEVRVIEKQVQYIPAVLYRVYESNELIYIGIGGIGNRKASGRLREHYKATMPSSFKNKILWREIRKNGRNNGLNGEEMADAAEAVCNSLGWCYEIGTKDDIKMKEKELIKEYQPKYNIEFK